ncbi:Multidrug resistance-associated protein 1 [Allomyces arbusculus]|nr:Multidrug resistance-associated protein 1 [Allomyces arbusculus]
MTDAYRLLFGIKMVRIEVIRVSLLSAGTLATAIAYFVLLVRDDMRYPSSSYFGAITLLLTLAVAVPTHYFEHFCSRRPSMSLCTFYLALALVFAIRVRTLILVRATSSPFFEVTVAQLVLVVLVLLAENDSAKAIDARVNHDNDAKPVNVPGITETPQHESPELSASYLFQLGLWWVRDLLWRGQKQTLVLADFWRLPPQLQARQAGDVLQAAWDREVTARAESASFARAYMSAFAAKLALVTGLALTRNLVNFASPLFVQYLIRLVMARGTDEEKSASEGVTVAIVYMIISILAVFIQSQMQNMGYVVQVQVRNAVQRVVYHKALRLPTHPEKIDAGAVLSHMQMDAESVASTVTDLGGWLPTPIMLAIALYMLYTQVGWSMFMAVGVLLFSSPVAGLLAGQLMKLRMAYMEKMSERTSVTTDTVGAAKTLKLFGWTQYMRDRILGIRDQELDQLKAGMRVNAYQMALSDVMPYLSTFSTFAVYALTQPANSLTPDRVFVTLSLFSIVENQIQMILWGWGPLIEAKASMDRLGTFLRKPERDAYVDHQLDNHTNPVAVEVTGAQFAFDESKPVLTIDHLAIPRGSVTAQDRVWQDGATQPWIQQMSVRDNILFGRAFDQARYDAVLDACALAADIVCMPRGDMTLVGEKGITLSGGQRARVACARALYADADVILLDDPLSAVDAHVDRHMFDAWFGPGKGLLRGKTVVLVTHAIHHLANVDQVIALKEGKIVERGTYDEVMAQHGVVFELVGEVATTRKSGKAEEAGEVEAPASSEGNSGSSGDDDDENKENKMSGKVAWTTYKSYLSYVGVAWSVVVLAAFVVTTGLQLAVTFWMGLWGSASSDGEGGDTGYWLGGYAGMIVATTIAGAFTFYLVLAIVALRVAKLTMAKLLTAVLRAPMSWWDVTPSGRILNRMTSDQRTIDRTIPSISYQILTFVLSLAGTLVTIATATPWFLIALIPIVALFMYVQRIYLSSSREIKRVSMAQNSSVFQHLNESLEGLETVRAFAADAQFETAAEVKVDLSATGTYTMNATRVWLLVQLELLGAVMVGVFGILAVATPVTSTAVLGTALTFAMRTTSMFSALIMVSAALENSLVSMERVQEYMDVPAEASDETSFDLDAAWPQHGTIEFRDFSTRYRDTLDPVLKHINLKINAGERVGICGRTGGGKTSLMMALFRIIEATSGSIVIDGIDIATVGLQDVRSRLTILPQDAVLFDAPVRANLDPTGKVDDAALWRALEHASLADYVRGLEGQLEAHVARESMSAGQAQLMCLARALVRKSKVLVLDEATASMDPTTDAVVQETVRSEFAGCTVITIAHRIGTIMDADRIVVLDHGEVGEVGTPAELLADSGSRFYALAKESGLVQ